MHTCGEESKRLTAGGGGLIGAPFITHLADAEEAAGAGVGLEAVVGALPELELDLKLLLNFGT